MESAYSSPYQLIAVNLPLAITLSPTDNITRVNDATENSITNIHFTLISILLSYLTTF